KTVSIRHQSAVRSAHSGREISEELDVWIVRCLLIFRGIWVDHQPIRRKFFHAWKVQIGVDALRPERHADASDVGACLHPIDRTMKLGEPRDSLQIARLAADPWR